MENAVRDHQVEALVGKRSVIEVGLERRGIAELLHLCEGSEGRGRDVEGEDLPGAVLRDEPRVESGTGPDFQHPSEPTIEAAELGDSAREPELLAVPVEQELLLLWSVAVRGKGLPLVAERRSGRVLTVRSPTPRRHGVGETMSAGEVREIRPEITGEETGYAFDDREPFIAGREIPVDDASRFLATDVKLEATPVDAKDTGPFRIHRFALSDCRRTSTVVRPSRPHATSR